MCAHDTHVTNPHLLLLLLLLRALLDYSASYTTHTGPPPSGPWCSAPPET